MTASSGDAVGDAVLRPRWPLAVLYPASVCFFWACYLRLLAPLSRWLVPS